MRPKQTNTVPRCSGNRHGSVEKIRTLIGCDTPIFTCQIIPGSVTPSVLAEAENKSDSECGKIIFDEDKDPIFDSEREHDNDTPETDESAHDNSIRTATPMLILKEMVERQMKMIDLVFQYNTKLLERQRSSTSDSMEKFSLAQPKPYCGGARELGIYFC